MASIQFSPGVDEVVIPEVRLTRSKSGNQGTATFIFDEPKALIDSDAEEITGMFMVDEEGQLSTREVKAKFINGQPKALEGFYVMKSQEEWDRFMRFMERYAAENNLGFNQA